LLGASHRRYWDEPLHARSGGRGTRRNPSAGSSAVHEEGGTSALGGLGSAAVEASDLAVQACRAYVVYNVGEGKE
jgi:hypothetical protein